MVYNEFSHCSSWLRLKNGADLQERTVGAEVQVTVWGAAVVHEGDGGADGEPLQAAAGVVHAVPADAAGGRGEGGRAAAVLNRRRQTGPKSGSRMNFTYINTTSN